MKKLLVYLKDYKKETVLAPLFKMLEATFELFVPLVMAAIIDQGIGSGNVSYVLRMGGVMILPSDCTITLSALIMPGIKQKCFIASTACSLSGSISSSTKYGI